jgi:type I restriction-modification system DNA methylase subunit
VEEELYHLIRVVLDKHGSKLNGVEFGKVQPQHSVDGGVADLVLPFADGKHFLVIECKRKITKPSGIQTIRDFDIFGSNVLNQALNYAVRLGTLCFATTNGSRLALFRTPKAGEPFRIDTHRLFVQDPLKLEEKNVEELLSFLSKWHTGVPVRLVEIDWFFISRLRSFVDFLSKSLKPVVKKLASDEAFSKKLKEFSKRVGGVTSEQLARETAYLLMNKIIFYKILERHYEDLPKLKPISAPDGKYFMQFLKGYFEKAIQVTGDFEPIFITEFYDDIPLPDVDYVWDEANSFIEEMDTYQLEEIGSNVVGHIYEELLPDEERHKLGQFYTPPPIAELIVKWAVRNDKDVILDPAVGSGTFLVKAYQRLMELKLERYRKSKEQKSSGAIHKEILSQLYADDINPFPAHLTSMNLAMRNVQYPTSEMNIIVEDFFNLGFKMDFFAPYVVKTPKGEVRRHITIPTFDAVVGNPPYTRGVEITDKTQRSINIRIGELLKKYKLSGGIGKETGIYVHFMMYANEFLKKNGRLGMIVSNSWLQSDYGINFSNFLLDHFKVKAVIDFNQRLFRIPLVATCVLLLEKEENLKEREKNKTAFLYVNSEAKVEEILDALVNPEGWKDKFLINDVKQSNLPRNTKWINIMFDTASTEEAIQKSPLICKIEDLFDTRHGNMTGIFARGGTGANPFFYLSKEDVEQKGLDRFVQPLLSSSRYSRYFIFGRRDWEKQKREGKVCYALTAHAPKNKLPRSVLEYIKYGEEDLRTRVGKTCDQSMSSQLREQSKGFFGWYDLGEKLDAPIYVPYYAQYMHRFTLSDIPLVLDADFISFIAKSKMKTLELKALLAYLNSAFNRFYVETHGRTTGGGMLSIEVNQALKMPVLDVRRLRKKHLAKLSDLFDKLEIETRKIGGADSINGLEQLQTVFAEIDTAISEALAYKKEIVNKIDAMVQILFKRRVSRTEKASPESIGGEEEPRISPPRKMKKQQKAMADKQLTRWIE